VLGIFCLTAISSAWVYHDAAHEVEELFDASLVQSARVLHGMISRKSIDENKAHLMETLAKKDVDLSQFPSEATPHGHKYEKKVFFQVWSTDDELLLRSASIHEKALAKLDHGYQYQVVDGYRWRTFTIYSEEDDYWLVVGERDDIRNELTHNIARDHIVPLLFSIPLSTLLIWIIISRAMGPLNQIAKDVENKEYDKLEKIENVKIPQEVKGLLAAINSLFNRLNLSYDREKRFVSDAAHELRNPLASLMIHADNAIADNQEGKDKDVLNESLINMKKGISRLSHLILQLLELSRTEASEHDHKTKPIDVGLLCEELVGQFQTVAAQKNVSLSCNMVVGAVTVAGNEELLASLVNNLIDNAVRYSSPGDEIKVNCQREKGVAEIVVEDSGPGVSDDNKERVLDRFYRISGSQETGSGLGLSIVKRVAELHSAELSLVDSALGGLKVSIIFDSDSDSDSVVSDETVKN